MVGLFWHLFCQMDFVSGLSRQIAASFDDASTWLQLVLRCFASAPAKQSWRGDEQNEDEITVQTVRRWIRCQQLNNKQQFFWTMKCNHYKLLVIHCDNPCLSTHDSLHLSILQPLGWRMPSLVIFCRFIEHWSHPNASSPHGGTAPSHLWPIFCSAPVVVASQQWSVCCNAKPNIMDYIVTICFTAQWQVDTSGLWMVIW